MKRIKLYVLAVGYMLTLPIVSDAQSSNYLSMDAVVDMASRNSSQVQIAELEKKISTANYKQTDAVLLPQLSVGYQAIVTNNPLNAFGFLLQQESVTPQDFDPANLNHPGAKHNYGTSIDARMPLFNLDMIYARKGAKIQQDVYQHQLAYTKEYISFEARKAYTQLQFSYQLREILRSTLTDVKQIHRSVSNFYEQGLVQQSDVLNALVQVNTVESALSKAESNIENASEGLHLLMGNSGDGQQVYAVDSLMQVTDGPASAALSPLRSDLMAMKSALEASKMMEKSANMALVPKVNAFGSYQLNDSKVFGFGHNSYLAGISLTWNLFSGNQNTGKIKAAQFTTSKVEKELSQLVDKSKLELNKSLRELKDYQIEINKNKANVMQAGEALRILNNRYREGLASTTDCLTAQAQLSKQRIALAQAVMAYNITKYYLELLTSDY